MDGGRRQSAAIRYARSILPGAEGDVVQGEAVLLVCVRYPHKRLAGVEDAVCRDLLDEGTSAVECGFHVHVCQTKVDCTPLLEVVGYVKHPDPTGVDLFVDSLGIQFVIPLLAVR